MDLSRYADYTPTVRPAEDFDATADAEVLRKAMKGFGTDEHAIIDVLAHRSNEQRQEIDRTFKTMYGKDLVHDLKSESSGHFEDLLVALMRPTPDLYAKELHVAISGLGTDEDCLIEMLCSLNNYEMSLVREAYESRYGKQLEDDIIGDTSGTLKRCLVSLCNGARDESDDVDMDAAHSDAQSLLEAGELILGTDESAFNMVFCQRNLEQLKGVFNQYENITGHDIEEAVDSEFSGDAKECLLAIIRSTRNRPAFFARRIHKALKGLGTNDRQLIRLIVSRCEIDMEEIKAHYHSKYERTLKEDIEDDTSGHYMKCLLALIGEY
ncbi:PREDICTED: annexin B11-like [Nicrophorus vespilloides]|uniref:Annexin n=1 Tax=Nicrophorus vespilloides TaxID=110193 RepID=A0ABM1MNC1_NICVS|nr:PREDICTED: annexin B11-like [Nicrophorus vespilloides]